jgi:dephospho-CoA kinase
MTHKTNSIIVGLTGQFGAGCSTVADYLQEEGFRYYSLSEVDPIIRTG